MADVMWLKATGSAFQTEAGKLSKSSENIVSYQKEIQFFRYHGGSTLKSVE